MVAIIGKSNLQKTVKPSTVHRSLLLGSPDPELEDEHTSKEKRSHAPIILLVDDCDITRTIIAAKLKKCAYSVLEAASGLEALNMVKEQIPDLILLDIMMQGIDGLETCRQLKTSSNLEELPIIFLSGKSDKAHVVAGLECGAADYIVKPFDIEEAVARINTHLKISQLNKEKQAANLKLKEANAAKDKLLSVTSHDLKNPLAAIQGLAEYLANGHFGSVNQEQLEVIRQIMDASSGMLDLVGDLLSLSILESTHHTPQLRECELAPLVCQLAKQLSVNAAKKHIQIMCEEEHTSRCTTRCDDRLIRRVVQNLVSNAIKFSPANTTIHVRAYPTEQGFSVEVDDEGPGIPESEHDKLFQEYGRTSVKTTGGESSTGLGLSICKKIMDAHHGKIGIKNLTPQGARFYFHLPKL